MNKAYSTLEIKSVDESRGTITGIASTPSPDRMKDVVVPEGAVFNLPIPLLWQHDAGNPIGNVIKATVTPRGIEIVAEIARGVTDEIDRYYKMIKAGLVRGLSIGFSGLETEPLASGGVRWKRWSWLELSAVTIPCNAECSIANVKHYAARRGAVKLIPATRAEMPTAPDTRGGYFDAAVKEAGEAVMKKQRISRYEFALMMNATAERIQEINQDLKTLKEKAQ